jgi:hypothetical protein
MKTSIFIAAIAALLLATGTAHAQPLTPYAACIKAKLGNDARFQRLTKETARRSGNNPYKNQAVANSLVRDSRYAATVNSLAQDARRVCGGGQ